MANQLALPSADKDKNRMNSFRKISLIFLLLIVSALAVQAEPDAKAAVQTFFSLLKAQKYSALYDYLPGEMQQRMSRDQLTASLKRLNSFVVIDKLEIGRVQQKGDFAVVDTTIYGKLSRPVFSKEESKEKPAQEGKISVQQYLYKENGHWKVATSDSATRNNFLKKHPDFKQGFQFSQPKFFIKQNGNWQAIR